MSLLGNYNSGKSMQMRVRVTMPKDEDGRIRCAFLGQRCRCEKGGTRLCDKCWMKSEISEVGAADLFFDCSDTPAPGSVVVVTGHLWWAKHDTMDGVEYDGGFKHDAPIEIITGAKQ